MTGTEDTLIGAATGGSTVILAKIIWEMIKSKKNDNGNGKYCPLHTITTDTIKEQQNRLHALEECVIRMDKEAITRVEVDKHFDTLYTKLDNINKEVNNLRINLAKG